MMFVGIDPARSCGWALMSNIPPVGITLVRSGVLDMKRAEESSAGRHPAVARMLAMDNLLSEIAGDVSFVAYEDVKFHTGVIAAHHYAEHRAALLMWCHRYGVPSVGVPVATGKKALTGNGQASKKLSIAFVIKRFGVRPSKHDEADAIGVALGGLERWNAR